VTPPPLRRKPPPPPPQSAWTRAKVKAVLDAYKSFLLNMAQKHQLPPEEVASLVRDHQCDPDPGD
jgi:hypothetical protein